MDIDLYRTFLAIGDTGSFTAASQRVGRTQSAVSQQMKRLEETLGRTLFERNAGSVELTDHGRSLIEPARNIVETHSKAMAAFRSRSNCPLAGTRLRLPGRLGGVPDRLRRARSSRGR